ncbi:MAG: hypothetical protein ABSB75_06025 [Candidatus Limnocylindrales bacterium]|jgi:hypothetical protein
MPQSSASRGHWIVAIGAIVIVGAALLQWWQIGGGLNELPERSGTGISDGRVFAMFLAAVATLLLVTLPFASERPIPIDHPLVYLALLATLFGAFVWRVVTMAQSLLVPWPPQRGFGFWLAAIGLVLFARGVFEMFEERRRRLY